MQPTNVINIFDNYLGILKGFAKNILVKKSLSPNTVSAYLSDINLFLNFIIKENIDNFSDITKDDILYYLEECSDSGVESASLVRRLVSIKSFFKYLHREKIIQKNIAHTINSPKLWKLLPTILTIEEVNVLLNAFSNKSKKPLIIRNRTILEIMYSCGLRVSETVNLRLEDIKFGEAIIEITEKENNKRIVPIGTPAQRIMLRYIKKIRQYLIKNNNKESFVFLSKNGKKLTRKRIWNIVKNAGIIAGINKNIYPNIIRHSFASHLLAKGADLRIIQEMLGHSNIATTQIYTHSEEPHPNSTFKQFHPRA
jgi:integrase/recombinase XerD